MSNNTLDENEACKICFNELLSTYEGYKQYAYYCPAGYLTIGYGSRINNKSEYPNGITKTEAKELSIKELKSIYNTLEPRINKLALTNNKLAVLLDFCYNLGVDNFFNSTLYKRLLKKDPEAIREELIKWDKATVGGKKVALPGLTKRRRSEILLYYR